MAGINAAGFAPDFLAVAIEVIKLVGADCDIVELLQQPQTGEFADRMRQGVDADAEFTNCIRLFEQFAADAAGAQHQRRGKAPDTAPDDNRLHRITPLNYLRKPDYNVAWPITRPQAALSLLPSARPGSSA